MKALRLSLALLLVWVMTSGFVLVSRTNLSLYSLKENHTYFGTLSSSEEPCSLTVIEINRGFFGQYHQFIVRTSFAPNETVTIECAAPDFSLYCTADFDEGLRISLDPLPARRFVRGKEDLILPSYQVYPNGNFAEMESCKGLKLNPEEND